MVLHIPRVRSGQTVKIRGRFHVFSASAAADYNAWARGMQSKANRVKSWNDFLKLTKPERLITTKFWMQEGRLIAIAQCREFLATDIARALGWVEPG